MTDPLSTEQRIHLVEIAALEGRIIQGAWRSEMTDGRELVCTLAAFGPDITGVADCPAKLMPPFMANLVVTFNDGLAPGDLPWFIAALLQRARRWSILDEPAWRQISTAYRKACIREAIESASPLQPSPQPAHWRKAQDVCATVVSALDDRGDLARAGAAALKVSASLREQGTAAGAAASVASVAWATTIDESPATERAAAVSTHSVPMSDNWAADDEAAKQPAMRRLAAALFALMDGELERVQPAHAP